MNYCTIQDAWGSSISNSFNKYMDNNFKKESNNKEKQNNIEHFNEYNCNDFISHLHKCKKCQMIIKNNNNSHIISYLYKLINENKDFIILGLIILFILLFINLVNNLTT